MYFPVRQMLQVGKQIRDEYVWSYPILPGAVYTFQQLASNREWKLSGSKSGVSRAFDWINGARIRQYDGIEVESFEHYLRVRSLDYLSVGRTLFYAADSGPLEYLDPCHTFYNPQKGLWIDELTGRELKKEFVHIDYALPLGATGRFTSPLVMVIPSAVLAWLLREHDNSRLDGRKVREVIIVRGKNLVDSISDAIVSMMNLYTDPTQKITKENIPVAYTEDSEFNGAVQDMIGRLGLTSIPESFDREQFIFQYVNEIGAATGLALRHFWNSERSTNRALEEIQQQRQAQKGPETFVRTEQRLLNRPAILRRRFGPRTRMAFFEEVDAQTQKVRSEVLLNNAKSFQIYNQAVVTGNKKLSLEALIAWQQSEDVLPSELEFLEDVEVEVSDPDNLVENPQESAPNPSQLGNGDESVREKSENLLDYDEITINQNGDIIDRRIKFFPVSKIMVDEISQDEDHIEILEEELAEEEFSFEKALLKARERQYEEFIERLDEFGIEDESRFREFKSLTDADYQIIEYYLSEYDPRDLQEVSDRATV